MAKIIPILILICAITFVIYKIIFRPGPTTTTSININGTDYTLEIAKSMAQKSIGLMNRQSLCPSCGMIFVGNNETNQIFWMKNTLIPLDIIFLNRNGTVINIEKANPQPNTPDLKLTLHKSQKPSQYVIELNQGDSQKLNLKPGDKIDISKL